MAAVASFEIVPAIPQRSAVRPGKASARLPSISVIGLGYVGAVSMACLSSLGFRMQGVDVSDVRVAAINEGRSPIVEEKLEELLRAGVAGGRISASRDLAQAVLGTDVTFVSVGTPTAADGSCDLTYVREVSRGIGAAIRRKDGFHVVVMRCSIPPGTTLRIVKTEIEAASGKRMGEDFGLCFNPEFLREGVAVADFFAPPKTVIGASDKRSETIVRDIYEAIDKNAVFTTIAAAEMVKYADNVWHATKVAFANEVGRICKAIGIDSHAVMSIFVKDTKLNLSPYYLRPGFAFGGSCLPKEVRAVDHLAIELGVDLPLVRSLMPTNAAHIEQALRLIEPFRGKRIGFLGVTFKPATDDLRESPTLDLMSMLIDAGEKISAYDPNLHFGPHLMSQINYVRHASPHLAGVIDQLPAITAESAGTLVKTCDLVVVSHATDEFRWAIEGRPDGVHVLDLARLWRELPEDSTYQGIAW